MDKCGYNIYSNKNMTSMGTRRDHIKMLTNFLEKDINKYEKLYLNKTGLTNVITLENKKIRNRIIKNAKKRY